MKKYIHPLIATALFFTLSANKCAKPEPTATPTTTTMSSITGPRWNVEKIYGKAIQLPEGIENPYLGIADDGSIRGFGGCNNLMGTAKIDGGSISFPGLGSTKKYCEAVKETEDAYLRALRATNSYRIEGDKLFFLDKDKELVTFIKR